jgi:hypothetical protein
MPVIINLPKISGTLFTRPANESNEKKRKKKNPKLQKLHTKIPETQILLPMPLNPVCVKSQIEFAMNQRCTQKYKRQHKSP